jgi:hypothetical protein
MKRNEPSVSIRSSGSLTPVSVRHSGSALYKQNLSSTMSRSSTSGLKIGHISEGAEKFDWYAEKIRIEKAIASQREWNRNTRVSKSDLPDVSLPRLKTQGGKLESISMSSRSSTPSSGLSRSSGASPLSDIAAMGPRSSADKIYGNMDMARKVLGRSKAYSMHENETQAEQIFEQSGSWELAQALFQDTGAGEGSWQFANPRALELLPGVRVCVLLRVFLVFLSILSLLFRAGSVR